MTERRYDPTAIEAKWQKKWDECEIFSVKEDDKKPKHYVLEMLPYPSGRIHMGHVRNYAIGDVAARFRMMKGFSVLHPMGWDAFGLPAENAAIRHGIPPAKWTYENIDFMRGQLKRLGTSYDWSREFATCDPEYYRWEQLMFIKMYEKGLAYKKTSLVNWCNTCQTVLANEQVVAGECWRCNQKVEQRSMSQWFFRITDYAEELLRDIDDKLQGWPERVRTMQREWIGKSVGAHIDFAVDGSDEKIRIFTTRPDTLCGATFMSLAYEHPKVLEFARQHGRTEEVQAFIEKASRIDHDARLADTYEKEGVFTGAYCINPITGWKMPIYAANFVLVEYGTGAVMAVPAHDQRDFEFAKKYGLPIKVVIQPDGENLSSDTMQGAHEGDGILVDSDRFNGLRSAEAIEKIGVFLEEKGLGGPAVNFKLKDWCLSRQRYWGAPIPIVYCEDCGMHPVKEEDIPVMLPLDIKLTGHGGSPLAHVESFVEAKCPKCGGPARRETDTMDTFVESSWYILRYVSPKFGDGPVDGKKIKYWMPVDQYIGGIEHAVGHLIYCRFFTKVMRDLGFIELDEPVKNLMTQGMVIKDGAKMSKSKGNVVDPDEMIERYGADAIRLFSLFVAPPEKDAEWSDKGIEGMSRFVQRVWRLVWQWMETKNHSKKGSDELLRWQHKTIKLLTEKVENYQLNTGIAAIMEYVNYLYGIGVEGITEEAIDALLLVLSPYAPHMCEELWEAMGHKDFILKQSWPGFDPKKIQEDNVLIVVQVNGKLRDRIEVPRDADEAQVKEKALVSENVKAHTDGKQLRKVIYVPGRILNIVVS